MLQSAGLESEQVSSPEDVAAALQGSPTIRMVLCDWKLSASECLEWVRNWKTLERDRAIHFILLADESPPPDDAKSLFLRGISDIWIRPVPEYLQVQRLQVWLSLDASDSHPTAMRTPIPLAIDLVDPETLLLGRRIFLEQAEGMFAGSRRLGTYVGFIAVSISNIENVLARLGPAGRKEAAAFLANELRAIKRREDLLGRWSDEVFVLGSYFPKGESVEAFGRRVLGALQASRFPHAEQVGPLRFTVSGAWGPSRQYVTARDALEAIVFQAKSASAS